MGEVYRALDRLNRQTVALKRVATSAERLDFSQVTETEDESTSARYVALAREFQTLGSLRHPRIISVLDYGFDAVNSPYFTMSLLEDAHTIKDAAIGQPLSTKVELVIQLLQALAYLHRRGIVHRDLKPDNVLVTPDGEVRVLDFGLAIARTQAPGEDSLAGTLDYIAPEVLRGGPASEAADLYAVGVISYEIFVGQRLFELSNRREWLQDVLTKPVLVDSPEVKPEIAKILERLLEKAPENRYADAYQVIAALSQAIDRPVPQETVAIRESFLQSAPFVGRDRELNDLTAALANTLNQKGSMWLIGGESGVGKSRLFDELRIRTLVRGALVLHGQGVAEGGLSYQLWREPLRRLALSTDLSDAEAGILKQILPDISDLLERDIPDAPELEGQAGQQRLLSTLIGLFRKQRHPVVMILEDLQWALESLDVLKLLIPIAQESALLIVGNYRDDEKPDLPAELPGAMVIKLERLSEDGIAQLSESMLGAGGRRPELLTLLKQETEGNVFFLVEVVRTLADEAGRLSEIERMTLPARVFAGGVQQVVQRRLMRIPPGIRPLLNLAAVAGRQLDLALLRALDPAINLEEWLDVCANAAVLEVAEERWRFAHDKLREGLLTALAAEERQALHKQVATAYESVYAETVVEYAALIGEHYEQAGAAEQALGWYIRAGKHAQENYTPETAIIYYRKVLAFWEQGIDSENRKATHAAEVYEGLAKMLIWQAHYREAEEAFTALQRAAEAAGNTPAQARAYYGLAEAQERQGDARTALESATRAEGLARAANARFELARALWMKGWSLFRLGDPAGAQALAQEVRDLSSALSPEHRTAQLAHGLNLLGVAHYAQGQYVESAAAFEQALSLFQQLGDRRAAMSLLNNLGELARAQGNYAPAIGRYQAALQIAHELGNRDAEMVYLSNLGGARVGLGDYLEAETDLRHMIGMAEHTGLSEVSEAYRFLAEAFLGQHRVSEALAAAQRAWALSKELGVQEFIAEAWRVLGTVVGLSGTPIVMTSGPANQPATYDAQACFAESLSICEATGMKAEKARTLRAWARFELERGVLDQGMAKWKEARDIFTSIGATLEVERMANPPNSTE
jgi:predicted ATPase